MLVSLCHTNRAASDLEARALQHNGTRQARDAAAQHGALTPLFGHVCTRDSNGIPVTTATRFQASQIVDMSPLSLF